QVVEANAELIPQNPLAGAGPYRIAVSLVQGMEPDPTVHGGGNSGALPLYYFANIVSEDARRNILTGVRQVTINRNHVLDTATDANLHGYPIEFAWSALRFDGFDDEFPGSVSQTFSA